MHKTYSTGEFAKELGVHLQTVKNWCRNDEIDYTTTPGGKRRIPHRELLRLSGHQKPTDKVALYARVSSHQQKDNSDLDKQLQKLKKHAHDHGWNIENQYTDIGSGLNEERRELREMIKNAPNANYGRILITYQDRLTRFGFSYLKQLFDSHGIQITVIEEETDKTAEEELVDDMIKIVDSFSGKLYGMRSQKKNQIVEKIKQETKND